MPAIMAALVGLGTTASVAGPVAGGLLSKTPKERTATQLGSSDIVNAQSALALLSLFGVPISGDVLLQASPIQQALNRRFATPISRESRRRIERVAQQAIATALDAQANGDTRSMDEILAAMPMQGDERRALDRIAQEGGFASVGELLTSELTFRNNVNTQVQQSQQTSDLNRQIQLGSLGVQNEALQGVDLAGLDVNALRDAERSRLTRDIELRRPDVLAAAQFGGFNPAAGLEQLERQRQDADLEALNRAVLLATGNMGVQSGRLQIGQQAANLDPTRFAIGAAPSIAAARQGSLVGTTQSTPNNGIAAGVAGGLGAAGSSLSNLGLLINQNTQHQQYLDLLSKINGVGSTAPAAGS